VIRHSLAEGGLLLRQRALVSLALAIALGVPIALAGVTAAAVRWLEPVVEQGRDAAVVTVLLHPHMDAGQRREWIDEQRRRRPGWAIDEVPPEQLAARLSRWFPYLGDLFEEGADPMLPPLVEVSADDPAELDALAASPAVVAVGPRSSLHQTVARVAARAGGLLAAFSALLLAAACLLAAVWVHLELFRHAEEITVMRLVGATETTIRGPFLLAVGVPGGVAGVLAVLLSAGACRAVSRGATALGLPPLALGPDLAAAQVAVAVVLPLAVALFTLRRHGSREDLGES